MTGPPRVSVVVAVRNGEATIADCLDSLLALDYPGDPFEIVVVENCSTDRTPAILARYADRVRVVEEPRRGRSEARNTGVRHARGELVAFTDADCTVHRDWLRNLLPPLDDEAVGLVGGPVLARRPCNYVERYGEVIHDHERAITVRNPPHVLGANCAARRSTLEAVAGFDPAFPRSQDADLAFRLHRAGYRHAFEPGAIAYHRNESTLRGLFREGFQHGFWSVPLLDAHAALVPGRRRLGLGPYRQVAAAAWRSVAGPDRAQAACATAFLAGKQAGKVVGSARFRSLQL
jgi:cellulose synthase/poly-beta-1,6-N-acetylglucosamine synthase-like glycosyltransferase